MALYFLPFPCTYAYQEGSGEIQWLNGEFLQEVPPNAGDQCLICVSENYLDGIEQNFVFFTLANDLEGLTLDTLEKLRICKVKIIQSQNEDGAKEEYTSVNLYQVKVLESIGIREMRHTPLAAFAPEPKDEPPAWLPWATAWDPWAFLRSTLRKANAASTSGPSTDHLVVKWLTPAWLTVGWRLDEGYLEVSLLLEMKADSLTLLYFSECYVYHHTTHALMHLDLLTADFGMELFAFLAANPKRLPS